MRRRNIGMADELGSGVRNLFKFGKKYSGQDPQLIDGDVFKIIVPLDDDYSFDAETNKAQIKRTEEDKGCASNITINDTINITINDTINITINETQKRILSLISGDSKLTAKRLSETIGITERNIKNNIRVLKDAGLLEREGAKKKGRWIVKQ